MTIQRINTMRGGKQSHSYKIDGVKADGVTTLIGNGLPKPALIRWAAKSVAEFAVEHLDRLNDMRDEGMGDENIVAMLKQSPYTNRDNAARRGTEVHDLAEKLVQGVEVEVPDEIRGYVEACVRFLDDWQIKPVLVEAVVASRRWNYCGTLDLVADLPDGRRVLLDWKTSKSGIFGETALQLAAYRYADVYLGADDAEQPMADVGITDVMAVHITAAGYSVHPLIADEETFRTFTHVAHVARKSSSMRGLVGDPVDAPTVAVTA